MKRLILVLILVALTRPGWGEMKSSVTQFGITWTFDKQYEVGQFVNGDWWVKGPVTIASVSPAPSGGRHGSVVGITGGKQGYDDRGGNYDAGVRASFPLVLQADQTVISTISNPDAGDCTHGGGGTGWFDYTGGCARGVMKTQAVLTCVGSTPAANAFRPAFASSAYRPSFTTDDIKWSSLPMANPTPKQEDISTMLRWFERPFVDHQNGWTTQYTHAIENFCGYGMCIVSKVSMAAVYLMLNVPRRDELAIRLIQLGIDNYGLLKAGARWPADGGHASGRKFPILFAGVLLDDPGLKNVGKDYGPSSFGEDCQTYYDGSTPRWGIRHCQDPNRADYNDESSGYRTCCTSPFWPGQALAMHMMRATALWNHNAFFDYVDRWVAEEGIYGDSFGNGYFIKFAWMWYRNNLPTTSIKKVDNGQLTTDKQPAVRIMPNPMQDKVHFILPSYTGTNDSSELIIFGPQGAVVAVSSGAGQASPLEWDGSDRAGNQVLPGLYCYSIKSGGKHYSGKLLKAK